MALHPPPKNDPPTLVDEFPRTLPVASPELLELFDHYALLDEVNRAFVRKLARILATRPAS